ncbi:hypothetical protein QVD17_36989 [Tagetes erecta]|uniref:Reverse transcriptase Ty1/copia-type domain-containing protein n=1 Tax=Tagetes erecta TaxID=13708 RepID=A0AAD8JTQ6_TARER|nr:hypothetical protein QVD17_36989 [Tagetes erecta]
MRSIADDLALAQSPIDDEDLLVHILSQLGDDFKSIVSALKVRENPIAFPELFDTLLDHERSIKPAEIKPLDEPVPSITTVNYSQARNNNKPNNNYYQQNQNRSYNSSNNASRSNRSNSTCHFCGINGHDIRDCRKMAHLLRENNITITNNPAATNNTTTRSPWLVDSGASHHITSDGSALHKLSDYGDPDEIVLGNGKHIIYFMVYVDDIVLTGSHPEVLEKFISTLASRFSLKDLGMLHHFLGIEVIPTSSGLFLSQHRHIEDLLTNVKMEGAKDVTTPLCSTESLYPNDGSPAVDPTPYRQIIGSLQYLAFTRPDVSFAANRLSQFMHAPTQKHWQALKRVLRYLKGTIYHGLFLSRGSPLTLTAFADSDWGGTNDGGRSTSAYLLYLGSNIISWRSSRQKSVSRSSTEAEYKALANAAAELSWVQNILQELGITLPHCPRLFCDNTGATYLCANPVYHSRMKHVALDYHFVRERVTSGLLQVFHINTADQPADVLTKPLSRGPFLKFRSKIGVSDGSSILRGRIKDPPNPLSMATK